jgi:hypothetical protein
VYRRHNEQTSQSSGEQGRYLSMLIVLALATWVSGAAAQDEPLFIELPPGVIPGDVSGSGFTVVGSLLGGGSDPQFGNQGFYWMPTTGVVPIGGTQAAVPTCSCESLSG